MVIAARRADLDATPQPLAKTRRNHVTLGDIHGNALKLIYSLIEENILTLQPKEDYLKLRDIYKKDPSDLSSEDLAAFKKILSNAKLNKQKSLILVGDELSDRGNNDYFTLLVLQKLRNEDFDVEIMLSNHSMEFIQDFEKPHMTGKARLGRGQARSLENLAKLIKQGLVDEKEVKQIVHECYIPTVRAIGYTIKNDGTLSLFSHAPIGLETIKAMAARYDIPYQDDTRTNLIQTIDQINTKVATIFKQGKLYNEMQRPPSSYTKGDPIPASVPLRRLVWNRGVGSELEVKPSGGFEIRFVHGHIGQKQLLDMKGAPVPSHENLDTNFGKAENRFQADGRKVKHLSRHSSEFSAKKFHSLKAIKNYADKLNEQLKLLDKTDLVQMPLLQMKIADLLSDPEVSAHISDTNYQECQSIFNLFESTKTLQASSAEELKQNLNILIYDKITAKKEQLIDFESKTNPQSYIQSILSALSKIKSSNGSDADNQVLKDSLRGYLSKATFEHFVKLPLKAEDCHALAEFNQIDVKDIPTDLDNLHSLVQKTANTISKEHLCNFSAMKKAVENVKESSQKNYDSQFIKTWRSGHDKNNMIQKACMKAMSAIAKHETGKAKEIIHELKEGLAKTYGQKNWNGSTSKSWSMVDKLEAKIEELEQQASFIPQQYS